MAHLVFAANSYPRLVGHPSPWEWLKSCSVVCKAWTDAAQKHLHSAVTLKVPDYEKRMGMTRGLPTPEQYSTPAVARHVQVLSLQDDCLLLPSDAWDGTFSDAVWQIVPRLHNVKTLRLVGTYWTRGFRAKDWDTFALTLGRSVTTLTLRGCTLRHVDDLVSLLVVLPHVTSLNFDVQVDDSDLQDPEDMKIDERTVATPAQSRAPLKVLEVRWQPEYYTSDTVLVFPGAYATAFQDADVSADPEQFYLHWSSDDDDPGPLAAYLQVFGRAVTYLSLSTRGWSELSDCKPSSLSLADQAISLLKLLHTSDPVRAVPSTSAP